jgi:hypothetical protein
VDLHQTGDFDPYRYKTTDFGASWKRISSDIPRSVLGFVHVIREDPVRRGLLYVGTDNALYVSLDDGGHWMPLQSGLPPAPVYRRTIQEHFSDLVVATYGRGFYILDDLTPLRALNAEVLAAPVHLFSPRAAYRFRPIYSIKTDSPSASTGRNPPYGAAIHYTLKEAPKTDPEIVVLDKEGKVVRTFKGIKEVGMNRVCAIGFGRGGLFRTGLYRLRPPSGKVRLRLDGDRHHDDGNPRGDVRRLGPDHDAVGRASGAGQRRGEEDETGLPAGGSRPLHSGNLRATVRGGEDFTFYQADYRRA